MTLAIEQANWARLWRSGERRKTRAISWVAMKEKAGKAGMAAGRRKTGGMTLSIESAQKMETAIELYAKKIYQCCGRRKILQAAERATG